MVSFLSVLWFVLSSLDHIAHHKTGYSVMLLHWLRIMSTLGLLLYGSRLITIYIVMSVCEMVVGIAARRPSMTLFYLVTTSTEEPCHNSTTTTSRLQEVKTPNISICAWFWGFGFFWHFLMQQGGIPLQNCRLDINYNILIVFLI